MSKLATLTSLALLLTAGYALAQGTPNTMTSGRPSAVLTDAQCQEVWSKAVPKGDTLAQADAAPYIVNFAQVDTDNDGETSLLTFSSITSMPCLRSVSACWRFFACGSKRTRCGQHETGFRLCHGRSRCWRQ